MTARPHSYVDPLDAAFSTPSRAEPAPEPRPKNPTDIQERAEQLANSNGTSEEDPSSCGFLNAGFRNGFGGGFRNGGFGNGFGGGFRNGAFRNGVGGGFRNGAFRNW